MLSLQICLRAALCKLYVINLYSTGAAKSFRCHRMIVREFRQANWQWVTIGITAVVILCWAILLLSTMPPRSVVMATGPEGGDYQKIGKRYQVALARAGIRLKLVTTPGSLENLALLRDPRSDVNIALLRGGSVDKDEGQLESLGTVFYETLWVFHRGGLEGLTPSSLIGRKVSIGPVA